MLEGELSALEGVLTELRTILVSRSSHLIPLFDVFANEARFGRRWVSSSLRQLPRGAEILEVGSGVMLLSVALQREGFVVSSLEPIGSGFSAFGELQQIVIDYAEANGWSPTLIQQPAEELSVNSCYDFAFSINVMEHVGDVPLALERIVMSLKASSEYRFLCPNYLFPYEPHFNILALPSKRLTERLMKRHILESKRVSDPKGMWESLNWISVTQIRRVIGSIPEARVSFNREIMRDIMERVVGDAQFSARRSPWVNNLVAIAVSLGFHRSLSWFPVTLMPIIDCSIERSAA